MNKTAKQGNVNQLIYFVFFLSGISGLIYETVWLRMLSRILGSTVYATSIVLSAFMLGLTLGSYFLGKRADKIQNLIRMYSFLEIGIALTALIVFFLFNGLIPVYQSFHHFSDNNNILYRFLQSITVFFLLVVPTFLMGGTLPLLSAEAKKRNPSFARGMGNLYGLNTLGAVIGVLLSGFITIGSLGEFNTVLIGIFVNLFVGTIAFFVIGKSKNPDAALHSETKESVPLSSQKISKYVVKERRTILFSYFIIGFTAFAIELVWTRLFQLQLGTSIYAFSMVLGIYLLGSALGSLIGGKYYEKLKDPLGTLALALGFIGLYSIIGIYIFCQYTPQHDVIAYGFSHVIVPVFVVFPITFVLGFIFPIVTNIYVEETTSIGGGIGRLYSANTLGCILGSLISGYILIQFLGTRGTIILLSVMNVGTGLIVLLNSSERAEKKGTIISVFSLTALTIVIGFFSPDPFYTVIKKTILSNPDYEIYYHKEGVTATTTAYGSKTNLTDKHILINGIGMTALVPETKIMSHLPILIHNDPHEMLIICFGMGTCLRSAVTHKEINCDVVELVGEEYETFKYFHKDAAEVLANKRVHPYTDDGRNFLLMQEKKYDVIVIDPAPPLWSAGTVNLYTSDFFGLCKKHLNTNGIMCMWIPPESKTDVKMIMRSFYQVFPKTTVYGGASYPGFFLIGGVNDFKIDSNRFMMADQDKEVMKDLNEWGMLFKSSANLLDLKIMSSGELKKCVENSYVITDNFPYTEFPLWRLKFDKDYLYWFSAKDFRMKYPN
ncbi:MAG: fused MFS/spermidine synthase [Bacteroidia bacterium]